MKIIHILNELFSEKLTQNLISKFKSEKPNLADNTIIYYLKRFYQIKDSPKVKEKDITKYSWKDLETLVDRNQPKTYNKNIKISDSDLIYNQDNLKIYRANTQQACVKYGNGYSFCISARGEGNMYHEYRYEQNSTIFFVRDLDRTTEQLDEDTFVDPHHLIVIMTNYPGFDYNFQPMGWNQTNEKPNQQSWQITTANNDGDINYHSFQGISQEYPKLRGLESLFKPVLPVPHELEEYKLKQHYNKILKHHYRIYEINRLFLNMEERECAHAVSTVDDWEFINEFVNNHEDLFIYTGIDSKGKKLESGFIVGNLDPEKWKKDINDHYSQNNINSFVENVEVKKMDLSDEMIEYLQKEWEIMSEYLNKKTQIEIKKYQ